MWQNSYDNSPTVYLIPTPIGNLEDITLRGLNILKDVDVIFSEDTRVTIKLLNYYNIKKKLIHLDDHNEENVKNKVLEYLQNGNNVGIVTDRGTPLISDPGYKTVRFLKENGYNVVALPGACAFVPAIVASSIKCEHFTFYGFLSNKEMKMRNELEMLREHKYTLIFYEAPHRILKTLSIMLEILGNRYISISREISKLHESIFVGYISDAIETIGDALGEYVIVVSPCDDDITFVDDKDIIDKVNLYIEMGFSKTEAIKKVAKESNISKNVLYSRYHRGDNL